MLDLTKPVQTRGGDAVRIVATDVRSAQPIVAIVSEDGKDEEVWTYCLDGSFFDSLEPSTMDLVNIITPHAVLKQELVESLSGRDGPSAELVEMRERVK